MDIFFDDISKFKYSDPTEIEILHSIYVHFRDSGMLDKYIRLYFNRGDNVDTIEFKSTAEVYRLENKDIYQQQNLTILIDQKNRIERIVSFRNLVNKTNNTESGDNSRYSDMEYLLEEMDFPITIKTHEVKAGEKYEGYVFNYEGEMSLRIDGSKPIRRIPTYNGSD